MRHTTRLQFAGVLLSAAPLAAQEFPLVKCEAPREGLGYLRGHGSVLYRLARDGRPDTATVGVIAADGISAAGYRSAVVRQLSACRMAKPEATTRWVRQGLRFDSTRVAIDPATETDSATPILSLAVPELQAITYLAGDSLVEERPRYVACDEPRRRRAESRVFASRAEAEDALARDARRNSARLRARLVLGRDGRVIRDSVQVLESDNPGARNDLLNSLLACRYTPARIGGVPVQSSFIGGTGVTYVPPTFQ